MAVKLETSLTVFIVLWNTRIIRHAIYLVGAVTKQFHCMIGSAARDVSPGVFVVVGQD